MAGRRGRNCAGWLYGQGGTTSCEPTTKHHRLVRDVIDLWMDASKFVRAKREQELYDLLVPLSFRSADLRSLLDITTFCCRHYPRRSKDSKDAPGLSGVAKALAELLHLKTREQELMRVGKKPDASPKPAGRLPSPAEVLLKCPHFEEPDYSLPEQNREFREQKLAAVRHLLIALPRAEKEVIATSTAIRLGTKVSDKPLRRPRKGEKSKSLDVLAVMTARDVLQSGTKLSVTAIAQQLRVPRSALNGVKQDGEHRCPTFMKLLASQRKRGAGHQRYARMEDLRDCNAISPADDAAERESGDTND